MSEAGKITGKKALAARDAVVEHGEKQEDAEATVAATVVVDENQEDGSTGSGSVVVAKIVEEELTPMTAAASSKSPPTAGAGKKTKAPVEKNVTLTAVRDKPIEEEAMMAPPGKKGKGDNSGWVPGKSPAAKEVSPAKVGATGNAYPISKEKGSPKGIGNGSPKVAEKPSAEIISTKGFKSVKAVAIEVGARGATGVKKDKKADAEEGEGHGAATKYAKALVSKFEVHESSLVQDEGQTKEESKNEETKLSERATKAKSSPTPKKVVGRKPEAIAKNITTNLAALKEGGGKDGDEEDGEEDTDEEGEIKEETEEEGEIKDDPGEKREMKKDFVKSERTRKEDVLMEDASQSEEGGDRDTEMASADVETASNDGETSSLVDEATRKVEPSYSTRGRASGSSTPVPRGSESTAKGPHGTASGTTGARTEQWEKSVREALEDLGRGAKDAKPAGVGPGGPSFLEALGEEERRTRTRFLPAVDGIHQLRKNEIKSDLALARSIMSSAGIVASVASVAAGASTVVSVAKKSKKKKDHDSGSGGEAEAMDSDDGGILSSSEDDPADQVGACSGATIEVDPGNLLAVPSSAFVPPPAATHSVPPSVSNGEKNEDSTPVSVTSTGVKGILNNQRNIKSPKVVESVAAFNPPRPPESVGRKKQHRMLRWERRPADVEVDLNNYRKTVDRTRKELHAAEDELERVEATTDHLRRHFLGHIHCMDQECEEIIAEINSVQQKCVNAAGLLASRTRSRGACKASYLMRDVLTILKARGAELIEKGIEVQPLAKVTSNAVFGIGGVGGSGFIELNQHSVVTSQRIASAWVLEGDRVETPYGEGVVLKIFKPSAANTKELALNASSTSESPSKLDVDTPTGKAATSSPKSVASKGKKNAVSGPSNDDLSAWLGTRICVRLSFGIGYFSPAVVASIETPNTLSDPQLARRWSGIVESALSHAGRLDVNGMALLNGAKKLSARNPRSSSEEATSQGPVPMDVNGAMNGENMTNLDYDGTSECIGDKIKLFPFASRLLPTGTGRGNELYEKNAQILGKEFRPVLTEGQGVLGDKANEGVPAMVKEFEEERQESYILQAKVLQLRNELYRQRRIRTLNERTFVATRDRSTRVESLVAEMRTDLKSLRNRLDEELVELGIDQDRAEAILKAYYLAQDYGAHHDAGGVNVVSPSNKRPRSGEAGTEKGMKRGEGQKANGNSAANEEFDRQTKRAKVAV